MDNLTDDIIKLKFSKKNKILFTWEAFNEISMTFLVELRDKLIITGES